MEKQRWEESGRRRAEERRSEKRKRQKMQVREKVGRKVAKHCVFPMICGCGGSTSRLAKAAGAEPCAHMRDKKIARCCGAKHIPKSNCTKHSILGPLLEVDMSKKSRRCGAKHMSKSKCTKHTNIGPLLEVDMSKKCTPLWREAHFEVKMYKTHQVRTTFGS